MKSKYLKSAGALIVGALVGVLVACGGSSVAQSSGGLTQADVQAMIATAVQPLQQQVATLQAQVQALQSQGGTRPAVFITAPNAPVATRSITRAGPNTCTSIGTLTGRPTQSDAIRGTIYSGLSCTLYNFNITGAATAADSGLIQPLSGGVDVDFTGANCTGNAFVRSTGSVSPLAVASGVVFTLNPQDTSGAGMQFADYSNPANYWYIPAGQPMDTTTPIVSSWQSSGCFAANVGTAFGWAALPNDPVITGIQSAPVQGPVLISN